MKNKIHYIFIFFAMFFAAYGQGQAQTKIGDLYYNLDEANKTAEVTSNTAKYTGAITIPATVTDDSGTTYSVTSIGNLAFQSCNGITSIEIPNSIASIGFGAFNLCKGLTNITIPNSVTAIGDKAFTACDGLTDVTIGSAVESIGQKAFYSCDNIDRVTSLSTTPPTLGTSVFTTDVYKKATLYVPKDALETYKGVSNWNKFSKKSSITTFNYSYNYDNLTAEVISNDQDPYTGDIIIPSTTIHDDTTYDVISIGESAFNGCSGLTSITIPNSVTSIGDLSFFGCSGLTKVSIGSAVETIGNQAFNECDNITKVTSLNTTPPTINENVFTLNVYSSAELFVPNAALAIYIGTDNWKNFRNISGMTTIYYNYNENNNTAEVIKGEKKYTEDIVIPSKTIHNGTTYSVTSIGASAFEGCSGLKSITIPNSVTSIGELVFDDCSGLTSINVDSENTKYSSLDGVLFNKDRTELITYPIGQENTAYYIPNFVNTIGACAFAKCTNLTSIEIPNSVTSIKYNAFVLCRNLTSIDIPNSVTVIGDQAFWGCNNLTNITIGASVQAIGSLAFGFCSGLTNIIIPNTVTSIGVGAFGGCSGLTSINVDSKNTNYCSVDGVLFNKLKTELIQYPAKKEGSTYTIPNSVTFIGEEAFAYCSGLESITIPNSVTSIGQYAFSGTAWYDNQPDGLVYAGKVAYTYKGKMPANTSIVLKDDTKAIADGAFYGCSGLTSIDIPNSVTSIGEKAFMSCENLTSITIPNSVIAIGDWAFYECSGLERIEIPNSVTAIGYAVFYNCTNLTKVTIPNSVTSIGDWAFGGCSGLTSIDIPNSVTAIGDYAFYGCSGLTDVTIGTSVTSIGNMTFSGCSNITKVTSLSTTPPTLGDEVFTDDVYTNATLEVYKTALDAYNDANGWKEFKTKTTIETSDVKSTASDDVKIISANDEITVTGASEDAVMYVYNMDGMNVYSGSAHTVTVPATGLYIVRIGNKVHKVMVK